MINAKKSGSTTSRCDTTIDSEDGQTYALRKVSSYLYVAVFIYIMSGDIL